MGGGVSLLASPPTAAGGKRGCPPHSYIGWMSNGDLNNYGWAGWFTLYVRNGLTNRWWSNASRISYSQYLILVHSQSTEHQRASTQRKARYCKRGKIALKKSCKHIDVTNPDAIQPFIRECLCRHKKRGAMKKLLLNDFAVSRNDYSELLSNDVDVIDSITEKVSKHIAERIKTRTIPDFYPVIKVRHDPTTNKERLIGSQPTIQQFYDYVAVRSCEDLWKRRLVPQQCSSIKGRGQEYGKNLIRGYILKDNRKANYARKNGFYYSSECKYFVKLDIRKCYPSMDKEVVLRLFDHDCGNLDIIYLWKRLLDSYGNAETPDGKPYTGLLIGALPSQWISQLVISYIYRYAMNHGGASHMVLFMDDMLLIGPNKRKLERLVKDTIDYTRDNLHLDIKPDWKIKELAKESIDMMGYVIHRSGKVSIRSRSFVHARRLMLRFQRGKFGARSANRLVSYKGFFLHSNCSKVFHDYPAAKTFAAAQRMIARRKKA